MMKDSKGMSAIIVTVIMIGLVLAAISVVWVVVNNVLEDQTDSIGLGSDCLKINLDVTKMVCDNSTCNVTINRKAGGDEIGGVKLVFSNSESGNTGTTVEDVSGNIAELGTVVTEDVDHGLTDEKPNTIEVTPYFLNENGGENLCSQSNSFEF